MTSKQERAIRVLRQALQANLRPATAGHDAPAPLWTRLTRESAVELQRLIRRLARRRRDVYGAFGDEDELLVALTDAAERLGDRPWQLENLLDEALAAAIGDWVVVVPLVGVGAPPAIVALTDDLALVPAGDRSPTPRRDVVTIKQSIEDHFGTSAHPGSRYVHDAEDRLMDTRRDASLIVRARGSAWRARALAYERARLLLAAWTLRDPPADEIWAPLWPAVTDWLPHPLLHVQATMHGRRDDGTALLQRGAGTMYDADDAALWPLPDIDGLQRGVRLLDAANRSRGARAILAAAWQLQLAVRVQSELSWVDRLVCVVHAREALCARPDPSVRPTSARFRAAWAALEVNEGFERDGWHQEELEAIETSLQRWRNTAVHGTDAVLLRLGLPIRSPGLPAINVREATSPAFHAIRRLALAMWQRLDIDDFDDATFDGFFAGT